MEDHGLPWLLSQLQAQLGLQARLGLQAVDITQSALTQGPKVHHVPARLQQHQHVKLEENLGRGLHTGGGGQGKMGVMW